MKLSGGEIV